MCLDKFKDFLTHVHHNLFQTLSLGSKSESSLVYQPSCTQEFVCIKCSLSWQMFKQQVTSSFFFGFNHRKSRHNLSKLPYEGKRIHLIPYYLNIFQSWDTLEKKNLHLYFAFRRSLASRKETIFPGLNYLHCRISI